MADIVLTVVTGLVVVIASVWIVDRLLILNTKRNLKKKRQEKRRECQGKIDQLEHNVKDLEPAEVEKLTLLSLPELLQRLEFGTLKAVDVLRAFQHKALDIHKKTNCLVEPIAEANKQAEEFDAEPKEGLLAGLPVSIKDDVGIKGYESTLGLSNRIGKAAKEDSVLVKVLKKHGAIPFMRTHMPQISLSYEPGNPIFGTVHSPYDPSRGTGGSSSGEGALVAAGGSVLGFGSDLGGSIRSPCHFSGVCGFKPTKLRISRKGIPTFEVLNDPPIAQTWGPLARDVDSVVLAMKVLWDGYMCELDSSLPNLPFDKNVFESKRPLKIGYFYEGGVVPTTPTCRRALDMAKEQLIRNGHELVPWQPAILEKAGLLEAKVLLADGGETLRKHLKYDEIHPTLMPFWQLAGPSYPVRLLKAWLSDQPKPNVDTVAVGMPSILEYWDFEKELQDYRHQAVAELKKAGLDAVISPPFPFPALPLGSSKTYIECQMMMVYNLLDWPAGIVRMTKMNAKDQDEMKAYPEDTDLSRDVKEAMKGAEGMPVGVQVAALRWHDEMALRVMKEIEEASDYTVPSLK